METVGQLFGTQPRVKLTPPDQWPQPQKVWANYDAESDSLILYLTGKPVRGVQVWIEGDVYLIVEPTTHEMVGMYFGAWERSFVPAHADVEQMWREFKTTLVPDVGWNQVLRAIALWIVMIFLAQANSTDHSLQPI